MKFGDYFKDKRLETGLTLRKFAETKGVDAAYISRLENNITPAPSDTDKLAGFAVALGLDEGTKEWVTFFDLAATSRGMIPQDIRDRIPTPDLLPAFYRTLRRENMDKDQVDKLLRLIEGEEIDAKAGK